MMLLMFCPMIFGSVVNNFAEAVGSAAA